MRNFLASSQLENKVESALLLDVVVGESAVFINKLIAGEDEALLIKGDALLRLDLALQILDGVGGYDFEDECLTSQNSHEDYVSKGDFYHTVVRIFVASLLRLAPVVARAARVSAH